MATHTFDLFSTSPTETPSEVIPVYVRKLEDTIKELENDILVTQKQLQATKAALEALRNLK